MSYQVHSIYLNEGKLNVATMLKEENIDKITVVNGRHGGVRTITEQEEINDIIDLFLNDVYVELDKEKADQLAQHYIGFVPDTWVTITCHTADREFVTLTIFCETGLEITFSDGRYICKGEFTKNYMLLRDLLYRYGGK